MRRHQNQAKLRGAQVAHMFGVLALMCAALAHMALMCAALAHIVAA